MGRKLHLKENAITDMRNLGLVNIDHAKTYLDSYVDNYVNLQDCTIREIPRPRTFAAAKKNPYPIIAVKSHAVIWQSYGKPRLEGPAIYGIYGNNGFHNVDGDEAVRTNFADCDKFYEIVPINPDTYKSAGDIRRGRERTYNAVIDDSGKISTYYDGYGLPKGGKIRRLTQAEIDSYDVAKNRKKYIDILSKNHLNKYIKQYDELCNMYTEFIDRIRNIGLGKYGRRYMYEDIFKKLSSYVDAVEWVNGKIEDIDRGDTQYADENSLKREIETAREKAAKLDTAITNMENIQ